MSGVTQLVGCPPTEQNVTGSIASQGTCLDFGPGPLLGMCKRQLIDVSLVPQRFSPFLSPSLPFTLK